jgi:hypothetical protein
VLLAACSLSDGNGEGSDSDEQLTDVDFRPQVSEPKWETGAGPRIAVDEAHLNFHTADGRYRPFARLAQRDGFVVETNTVAFTDETLANFDILVIANALHERNVEDWSLPTPSAFTTKEVEALFTWVNEGGRLLLIVDHMPFPGAAAELGAAFDIEFGNGFALRSPDEQHLTFERASGGLRDHVITRGQDDAETVDHVMSFVGTAFTVRSGAPHEALLVLPAGTELLMPEVAWEFSAQMPRIDASGQLQGVAIEVGRGRVAAFGEAGMFTAQFNEQTGEPIGMNHRQASDNAQFVLNVLHWLAGIL